ncbi:MAG: MBL fold metallo-hydrolase [Acidobacteriota bacterium]|nr:MBL fold metallo-hydrolase [Acidobacteriota bacterium]
MLIERSMHPKFLSNTYLVAESQTAHLAAGRSAATAALGRGRSATADEHDQPSQPALFIDAGGPVEPLILAAERLHVEPTHVLLTHHHFDHVCEVAKLRERWPAIQVLIEPSERGLLDDNVATGVIEAGETLSVGNLTVRPLRTPGHTGGMLSFLVSVGGEAASRDRGSAVFTGDTLFKGSVGGVRAPGHTTYQDLKDSIMGTLMELPPTTVVYPGHADLTTVAEEWERNAFVRVWRGLDPERADSCEALGQPATLVLLAPDYDGGHKAWVRWENGADDIVPGSRVALSP